MEPFQFLVYVHEMEWHGMLYDPKNVICHTNITCRPISSDVTEANIQHSCSAAHCPCSHAPHFGHCNCFLLYLLTYTVSSRLDTKLCQTEAADAATTINNHYYQYSYMYHK